MATLTLTEYGMIGYTGASKNQYGVHPRCWLYPC